MHSSNNDAKNDTDVDNKLQIRQTNTPPTTSNSSQPSSPSCSTLLVIDDTSNSEDETINNNNNNNNTNNNHTNSVPTKSMPTSSAQTSHITPPPSSSHVIDILNDTVNQQRRRNSSIAKLLGGQPLRNQQYEEIHQQILDSQSAQNVLNNDNGTDNGLPRTRSSITRTLLMNPERTNSMTKLPPKPLSVTTFAKDFEYLIRRELDKVESEHASTTLQRNNSAPKVIQNLNSSPSNTSAQTPIMPSKLKRKRPHPKPSSVVSNIPPFSLHDPFEIESSGSTESLPSQTKYPHFDSSKRPRYPNPQSYPISMPNSSSSSSSNQSSYVYPNKPINSTVINQFNIYQDQTSSNPCSSSYNCPQYNLTLPTPVTHLSSSSSSPTNNSPTTSRKARSMLLQPDNHEQPRQRSYSNLSESSSPEGSPKTTVPLKKRLIDAYNNEHHQPTSL